MMTIEANADFRLERSKMRLHERRTYEIHTRISDGVGLLLLDSMPI